jgi:Leucine-rich repeat (LRR) protein
MDAKMDMEEGEDRMDESGRRGDWILVDKGPMKGMSIIVDQSSGEVVSLSSRYCRDPERWRENMPSPEGYSTSLRTLDLDNSRYLVELSNSIGSLSRLEKLYLTRCERLERLPDSICRLANLQEVSSVSFVY